jgi:hypothetical protein
VSGAVATGASRCARARGFDSHHLPCHPFCRGLRRNLAPRYACTFIYNFSLPCAGGESSDLKGK